MLRILGFRGARRCHAAEHSVDLVVFSDDRFVEKFYERSAVVLGRKDAVVLELHDGLLNRHPRDA